MLTSPLISEAQESQEALRLLAAQRRRYSDAKRIHTLRLGVVSGGALLGVISALTLPSARPYVGLVLGIFTFLLSLIGSSWEKRVNREAASIQEEFDTLVFQLPWNPLHTDRPTATSVTDAAQRYQGASLRKWYPETQTVQRPLDILICQRSNVGWGSTLHRLWARLLVAGLIAVILASLLLSWQLKLTVGPAVLGVLAPLMPVLAEMGSLARANFESAETKTKVERQILELWRKGVVDPRTVSETECRAVQDRILTLRQSNATVPDWLDKVRHNTNEQAMGATAKHLIEQAKQHGVA